MLEYKSGVLPKYYKIQMRKHSHGYTMKFGDDYFMCGLENSMYTDDDQTEYLYCEDSWICTTNLNSVARIFNPKLAKYVEINSNSSYSDQNSTYEANSYLKEVMDFVSLDYDNYNGCYKLDINKFLSSLSDNLCLKHDVDYDIRLHNCGNTVNCRMLFSHSKNIDYDITKGDVYNYFMIFSKPQDVQSFCNDMKDFVSSSKFGNKYLDIYNKVSSGNMSVEDFIKEINS